MKCQAFMIAAVALLCVSGAQAQMRMVPTVTSDAAKRGAEACEALANSRGFKVSVWVVDAAGMPIYMHRMQGAPLLSIAAAKLKAQTSWQQGIPTRETEDRITMAANKAQANVQAIQLHNFPERGGYPLLVDDPVTRGGKIAAGAVGVDGAARDQNDECARAAMETIMRSR
jgi:glc operon protein GlcG